MSQDDLEQIIDDDETIPHASSTSAKDIVTSTPFETSRCEKQTKIVYLKTHKVSFKKCACANMHFTSLVREQYGTKHPFSIRRTKQFDICFTQCRWKSEPWRSVWILEA